MHLQRQPLLLFTEQASVPVNWPKKIGYPPPGVMRKIAYPAGSLGRFDDWSGVPGGEKYAKAQAWMFLKPVRRGKKIYKY